MYAARTHHNELTVFESTLNSPIVSYRIVSYVTVPSALAVSKNN